MSKEYEIGDIISYPQEEGWRPICEVPELPAIIWAKMYLLAGKNNIAGSSDDCTHPNRWLNKVAIVVDDPYNGRKHLAIYKHNSFYYLFRLIYEK